MNYDAQLAANRQLFEVEERPWLDEWMLLRETKLAYKETYDYVYTGGTLARLTAEFKRDGMDRNIAEQVARSVLTQQPHDEGTVNKHKFAYTYWLDYQKKDFLNHWKPKETDGLNYMWLHFQFHSDTDINVVKVDMARIVNLPVFKKCKLTYVYEYYTASGAHPHVHMLVELNRTGTISPSTLKEKVFQYKKLSEYMSLTYYYSWASGEHIIKRCGKRAVLLAYIDGNKKEEKEGDVEKDKLWRKENDLEDKYIKEQT